MSSARKKTAAVAARLSLLVLATLPVACEMIKYSPHQDDLPSSAIQVNRKNLARLQKTPPGDEIQVAFVTDTQNYYDESQEFVAALNERDDIDFVVHGGDITAFGIIQEFEWMHEIFGELDVPYLAVIGNHDLRANGGEIYQQVYGKKNFAFVYGRTKFIFADTNSRDYNFNGEVPKLEWLREQLEPSEAYDQAVVIGHVPPDHKDFDPQLEQAYADILEQSGQVPISLYGHKHRYEVKRPYGDVIYLVTGSVAKREYTVVTVSNSDEDAVKYETVEF